MSSTFPLAQVLAHCSPPTAQAWASLLLAFQRCPYPVYLIGGAVRDTLLQRTIHDLDFATQGNPIEWVHHLAIELKASCKSYPLFGTATLTLPTGVCCDFAMTRQERYVHPGALPQPQPSSIYQDVWRRDFTINTLALALNGPHKGQLLDLCGGQADLHQHHLRILHPQSFVDDPTRLLRGLRLQHRLAFQWESQTYHLWHKALQQHALHALAAERFWQEFHCCWLESDPFSTLNAIYTQQLAPFIWRLPQPKLHLQAWLYLKQHAYLSSPHTRHTYHIWLESFLELKPYFQQTSQAQIARKTGLTKLMQAKHVFAAPFYDSAICLHALKPLARLSRDLLALWLNAQTPAFPHLQEKIALLHWWQHHGYCQRTSIRPQHLLAAGFAPPHLLTQALNAAWLAALEDKSPQEQWDAAMAIATQSW